MKATAITVTHRKEKDVDIYTATRGPYELEIANVAHLKFTNATVKEWDIVKTVDHKTADWKDFFAAILKFIKENDQCTLTS
jgi:hypothetical protein